MHSNPDGPHRIDHGRRTLLKTLPLVGLAALGTGTAAAASPVYPEVIPLPDGSRPEGIVTGTGSEFFVGSLADGSIYRGDYRTGAGGILVEGDGGPSVGLSYDARNDALFVAGGSTGMASVYDASTGETLATYDFGGSFVNDVVVTRTAAYFTDSFQSVLYRVPLGPSGGLCDPSSVSDLALGGDWVAVAGFNANGIDAPPDGEFLVVVNSTTGLLYRVDPETGEATDIDLGGDTVTAGDGILLDGKTLYVVRNRLNQIAVVELSPGATSGELVGAITDDDFDVPTTVAEFGRSLYAVNARFGTPPTPTTAYDVVRVHKGPNA